MAWGKKAVNEEMTATPAEPAATGMAGMFARILALFEAGGAVVAILAVLSMIALTIVLVKIWQFYKTRMNERRTAETMLAAYRRGQVRETLTLGEAAISPAAQAVARAIRGQLRGLPEAKVREDVTRYGADILENLRSGLRPLEVIGSLAPLLGLFGTVLGMIEAFRQLEAAGSQVDPSVLSGGIWEALLTTAVGLAVAIPAVAALNWLERRIERLAHDMDSLVSRVFTEDLSQAVEDQDSHAPARLHTAASAAAGR